jgi:chromosome segregation ATPase
MPACGECVMENSQSTANEAIQEHPDEEFRPDLNPPWMAEQDPADRKRDLKERYFLTRKELRDSQRLLALRDEELRQLRLTERRRVERGHEEENLRAAANRLQSRVDELQRQLTDSRNQLRQARTEAAEKYALVPILEREASELRVQLEQGEGRLGELSGLLEQRERELQEKNGSLHEAHEISDRLDQRERDLLEREEQLHEAREQLGGVRGELQNARQAVEALVQERDESVGRLDSLRSELESARQAVEALTSERDLSLGRLRSLLAEVEPGRRLVEALTGERDDLVSRLRTAEASQRHADDTIKMLQEKLMESGEELIKLEESVRDYRYLMETLKREKTDQEAASTRAIGDLENRVEASRNECEGLREIIKLRRQEHEQIIAEKSELAACLEQEQSALREIQASMEEGHARKIDELKAESNRELTGVLRAHSQETDKLKMAHAAELGEVRDTVNRLRSELDTSRARFGRLQSEVDGSRKEAGRLRSELEEARLGIPRLVDRLEKREQAITDTRALLLDTLSRLEGLDQPPELTLGQGTPLGPIHGQYPPLERPADELWPLG